jgi:hypothetical protein
MRAWGRMARWPLDLQNCGCERASGVHTAGAQGAKKEILVLQGKIFGGTAMKIGLRAFASAGLNVRAVAILGASICAVGLY